MGLLAQGVPARMGAQPQRLKFVGEMSDDVQTAGADGTGRAEDDDPAALATWFAWLMHEHRPLRGPGQRKGETGNILAAAFVFPQRPFRPGGGRTRPATRPPAA